MTTWVQSQMCVWKIRMFLNATDILHKVHSTIMTSLGFRLPYPLKKRAVSIHGHIHILYGFHKVQKSHFIHDILSQNGWKSPWTAGCWGIYVFETLLYTLSFVKTKIMIILNIYDQNMMCVIASKGIRLLILNFNLQQHRSVWFIQTVHLKNKLILDKFTFEMIS